MSFNRVTVVHGERSPRAGPVLYVGLHRNGVMDAAAYLKAAPRARFVVSAQWHRNLIGRLLFPGIAVSRKKDRERGIVADNTKAFGEAIDHLQAGGELFILPEGTSGLGPRHLPFKPGAARLACDALARGVPITIVPLGIHYECAWEWQSRVEVLVGETVDVPVGARIAEDDMQARITAALEAVGVNVASEEELRFIEALAYAATLGTGRSYAECLKRFESGVPDDLRLAAAEVHRAAREGRAMLHQGVPLVPVRGMFPYLLLWLALAPLEAAFFSLNAPVVAAGWWASRKFPDDTNVIALWRMLVGAPAGLLWIALVTVALFALGGALWPMIYLGVCGAGIRGYYRFRKLSIALYNAVFVASLRPRLLSFRDTLEARFDANR